MSYFSERECGEIPQEKEEIEEGAWGGILALINARISDGSFGVSYPLTCEDGGATIGSNEAAVRTAMRADIPNLPEYWNNKEPPLTLNILDMIEFSWRCIGKPVRNGYHKFFSHHHLDFDIDAGRDEFRDDVNRIFRRNGLAYELDWSGCIERPAPPVLREELASAQFATGDADLDRILEKARDKFTDPDETNRREALEALWDAWERLKTVGEGPNKKTQITNLLDHTAGSSTSKFRDALESEANELTRIGNSFQIRHFEKNQERLVRSEHVDYLFHRLFGLIQVILRLNS